MQRHSAERVSQIMSAVASSAPVVEIKSYSLAGSGLARVVARVIHTAKSREDANLVRDSISAKFNNELQAVAGSFVSVDKGPIDETFTGLVAVRRDIISLSADASESDMKGFKAYASNMFLDDESNIWKLEKTGLNSLLIRTTGIDDDETLLATLSAFASSSVGNIREARAFEAFASAVSSKVEGGDFVSYVNATNAVICGYVLATVSESDEAVVLPIDAESYDVVKRGAITAIHEINPPEYKMSEDKEMEISLAASRGTLDIDMFLDYYKKLYAYAPEYYKQYAAMIRELASM